MSTSDEEKKRLNNEKFQKRSILACVIFLMMTIFSIWTIHRTRMIKGTNSFITLKRPTNIVTHTAKEKASRNLQRAPAANTRSVGKNDTKPQPRIPHNIIFTYKHDIIETKEPEIFYHNIKHTIKTYLNFWNDPDARVIFLDDKKCANILRRVEPELVDYFIKEKLGVYKADICRIASLFFWGGYYFDIDLRVLTPPKMSPKITFSTVWQPNRHDFFQAYMASQRGHPILRRALRAMLYVYQGHLKVLSLLGTETLKWSYDAEENKGKVYLLEEINLDDNLYPEVERQTGHGCCCNYAVHDKNTKKVHFFSRIVGDSHRCSVHPV